MFMRGQSMADIKQRGRWRSLETAERYVQTGRAIITAARVPHAIARAGQQFAARLLRSLSLAQMHC